MMIILPNNGNKGDDNRVMMEMSDGNNNILMMGTGVMVTMTPQHHHFPLTMISPYTHSPHDESQ